MHLAHCEQIVLPYGTSGVRPQVRAKMQLGDWTDLERPGAPLVVIEPAQQTILRLHSLQHPFTLPPVAQALAHAASQLSFLEQHLRKLCGDWAKPQQHFIERYIKELRAHVLQNEEDLWKNADGLQGLVEIEHWCFAAPMPLPRAHIYLPAKADDGSIVTDDFIPVDFAFWTGSKLTAVQLSSGNTPTKSRKEALGKLIDAGVTLCTIDRAILDDSAAPSLLATLGDDFIRFSQGVTLPCSPFRGREIETPVSLSYGVSQTQLAKYPFPKYKDRQPNARHHTQSRFHQHKRH